MRLLALELRQFRNHREARVALNGEPIVLLGENGSGKTGWVEAAVLLSVGRSFRGARDRDLTRRNANGYEIRGLVESRAGVRNEIVARGGMSGPRGVEVDGAPLTRLAELLGRFPTAHFSVEDVATLNGAPAGRRRFLDVALCQLEPAYVGHLRDYLAALKQRNRLLGEGGSGDGNQLGAWEEILARSGAELDRRRAEITKELNALLGELSRRLDDTLDPAFEYVPMVGEPGESAEAGVTRRMERLEADRGRDRRFGWTLTGPHRSPVRCRIDGRELVDGASRGMTRLYSILLRLALARVMDSRLEEPPVVLLDDPESELDPRWIGRVLSLAPETSQVVVTACRPLSETPGRYREIAMETLSQVEAR